MIPMSSLSSSSPPNGRRLSHRSAEPPSSTSYPSNPTSDTEIPHNGASASLPAPNTYSEYKRNKRRVENAEEGGGTGVRRFMSISAAGESGRRGFHPWQFLKINFRSASRASLLCNLLWPVVPAALAVRYALPDRHVLIFTLAYIAMVPCANLVGFAGQELSRKLPHVVGVLTEVTCGSIVEIILFIVLLSKDYFYVIKAAILGSILATMLLCLGLCFFFGGLRRSEQTFSNAVSETGSGLLLTAGAALSVPTVFGLGLAEYDLEPEVLEYKRLNMSRILAVLLLIAYAVFVFFQARTHHGIYDAIFERDEERDADKHKNLTKAKLTFTECVVALAIGIALVTLIAIILVLQIHYVIEESHVSDPFIGLILVPLVEKFAEHLTAIDEAWDNQMNFALSHVLGATLQTALFNGPLTIVVAWGLGKEMDLLFEVFNLVMLILAILTVGRFLQDQKSNYLEGFLLVALYIAIAVAAYHYPNPKSLH